MLANARHTEVCMHTGEKHDVLLRCHANAAALFLSFSVQSRQQLILCLMKCPTIKHAKMTAIQGELA